MGKAYPLSLSTNGSLKEAIVIEAVLSDLIKDALALNATHASITEVAEITFSEDFRKLCEQNL